MSILITKNMIITKKNIVLCLQYLAYKLNKIDGISANFTRTRRRVPIVVIKTEFNNLKSEYNICYFLKHKNFKVFSSSGWCYYSEKDFRVNTGQEVYDYFKLKFKEMEK